MGLGTACPKFSHEPYFNFSGFDQIMTWVCFSGFTCCQSNLGLDLRYLCSLVITFRAIHRLALEYINDLIAFNSTSLMLFLIEMSLSLRWQERTIGDAGLFVLCYQVIKYFLGKHFVIIFCDITGLENSLSTFSQS